MASLDVLDYQAGLDAELASAGMPAALRRQAVKDARRVVDAMAFRFALMDERPLPEDLDYLRALEAVKSPARAAPVLLARRPHYARTRMRRLTTTYTLLLILAVSIGGLAYVATSEEAVPLAEFTTTQTTNRTFVVTQNMTRLYVDGTVLHPDDAISSVAIFLNGPNDEVVQLWPSGDARNIYLRRNIEAPTLTPGEWTVLVDFNVGGGSVYMTILGVQPSR